MKFKVGDRVRVIEAYGRATEGRIGTVKGRGVSLLAVEFDEPNEQYFHSCGRVTDPHRGYWVRETHLERIDTTADQKIVITNDGKRTVAVLYDGKKVVKKAESKCHPDDEFDFMVGAKLAVERLVYHEPKFKVGDTVIVKTAGFGVSSGQVCKIEDIFYVGDVSVYGVKDEEGDHWLTNEHQLTPYVKPEYFTGKVVCVKVPDNNHWFEVGRVYSFEDGNTKINGTWFTNKPIVDIDDLNGRMMDVEFVKLLEDENGQN